MSGRSKRVVLLLTGCFAGGIVVALMAQPPQDGRGPGQRGFGGPAGPGGFEPPAAIRALDADDDHKLSKQEIQNAPDALRKLDADGDGQLNPDELDWPPALFRGGTGRGKFPFDPPPVLAAIDRDDDGRLSKDEIAGAAEALRKLDRDGDGRISGFESRPSRGGFGFGPPGFGPQGGPGFGGGETPSRTLMPEELEFKDGVAEIPDMETYHRLSYRGEQVMVDTFLAGLEFVKFTITGADTDSPRIYFINTVTHRGHPMFAQAVGLPGGRGRAPGQMKGVLVFRPMLKSPGGAPGLFTYEFEPFDQFSHEMVKKAHDILISKMPLLKGNIGYYPRERGIQAYLRDKQLYDQFGPPVYLDDDLLDTEIAFLPLNNGVGFGYLRLMDHADRPGPRDIVIYRSLPNELSRVAGVMTEVRQTPLSHVNLRAVQDRIPNAFIAGASKHPQIKPLIGQPVRFEVTSDGFLIRKATDRELQEHFEKLRPKTAQVPPRDLTVRRIVPLSNAGFEDSKSIGVKAANIAAMQKFGFPKGTIPEGFAVPFYFYDEFMKHNGFYDYVAGLLASPEFQQDREVRAAKLKELRSLIRKGKMPEWMLTELEQLHKQFPPGQSLRCRSSTNNEDLPGFSGAGLYDSYTHKPDEGHLSHTIRQVYSSMWNFRAVEERDFYRIDHLQAAMGVLVHPNYKNERANGVAVTADILYQTNGFYYVNTQPGEDLVTNPSADSVAEELLLGWYPEDGHRLMRSSDAAGAGRSLLAQKHLDQLRHHLGQIHARFARLYGKSADDPRFAMEIEFKVTSDDRLVIKQARPWVFSDSAAASE